MFTNGPVDAILCTAHRAKGECLLCLFTGSFQAPGRGAPALAKPVDVPANAAMVQEFTMQTFRYRAMLPTALGLLCALAATIVLAVQFHAGQRGLGIGIALAGLPASMLRGIVSMVARADIQLDDLGIRRKIFGITIRSITWREIGTVKIITSQKDPDKPFKVFTLTSRASVSMFSDMPIVMTSRVNDPPAFLEAMESYIARFGLFVMQENSTKDEAALIQLQGIESTPAPRPELENFGARFDADRARRRQTPKEEDNP